MSATLFEAPDSPLTPLSVKFTVYGTPRPQGSMHSFINPRTQKIVSKSQIKGLKPWRQQIAGTAAALGLVLVPKHTPVRVVLDFYFERPASVSERKRPHMVVAPDTDKLQRAVFDSLTGTILTDDAQIVDVHARKHYGLPERVEIEIGELFS